MVQLVTEWENGPGMPGATGAQDAFASQAPGMFMYLLYLYSIPGQLFWVIIVSYELFINLLCFSYTLNILTASS